MNTEQSLKCTQWSSLCKPHDHPRFIQRGHRAIQSSSGMPSVTQLVSGEPHVHPDLPSLTPHTLSTKPHCLLDMA